MGEQRYPDELVELVVDELPTWSDLESLNGAAIRVLDALAAAGRLVPDGSDVEVQQGMRCEHGDHWIAPGVTLRLPAGHYTIIRRTVITTPAEVVE
jgi:hypothetical protein